MGSRAGVRLGSMSGMSVIRRRRGRFGDAGLVFGQRRLQVIWWCEFEVCEHRGHMRALKSGNEAVGSRNCRLKDREVHNAAAIV